ncbi:MAG: ATP-binding protein [Candidatus Ancaeobacter aquaticus]|nr:ATP-binding protein [Candidatus Ancaeobacter aquaticus]
MKKQTFLDKFIERFDKIDRNELLTAMRDLSRENTFLGNILNSLNDGIIVLDKERCIQFINPTAREFVGVNEKDATVGKVIDNFIVDDVLKEFIIPQDVLSSQTINRDLEISFPRKLILGISIIPLMDESEGVSGSAIIIRDLTDKRRLEGRMLQSEKLGALSVLAAGLAHEVGNPLNSLDIHVQLIQREVRKLRIESKKKIVDLVKVVSDEILRLDTIVRNYIHAIRPLKPNYKENDINEIISSTVTLLSPEMFQLNIVVEQNLSKKIPKTISDKGQLKQAFVNIIKNAVQAMRSGGILRISTYFERETIRITVEDRGCGISPEYISRIFDPHFTTRSDGLGLGLMMTHRIIKEHGGDIEVKSQIDFGTVITVLLPLRTITPKMLPEKE